MSKSMINLMMTISKYLVNNPDFDKNVIEQEDEIEDNQKSRAPRSNGRGQDFLITAYSQNFRDAHFYFPVSQYIFYEYLQSYFETQRQRGKVTEEDEKKGKQILLKGDFINDKSRSNQAAKKDLQNLKKLKVPSKKSFKSDYEDIHPFDDEDNIPNQDLTQLKNDEDAVREQEDTSTKKHLQQKQAILSQLFSQKNFQSWKYFLDCGFNLLIYGIGSKRKLINNFIQHYLQQEPCIILNGFHSATTIKSLTNPIIKFIYKNIPNTKNYNSVVDQIEEIKRVLDKPRPENQFTKIYVIIHSMDVGALKNHEWQQYISELANVRSISLIVSVDHINSGIMWSDSMLDRFNFYASEVNTFEDFDTELEYQSPLFQFKNDNQEVGLLFVFKSMTGNQKKLISIIAQYLLDNPQEKGISYKELMIKCVEQMVCHSNKQMKDGLHEALDHKIVIEKQDDKGHIYLCMNYPVPLLEKIVNDEFK
ncbi:origin recognition complex subunit 2 [Stylonychia lemnae]|uniref:Origin recognition complex subunit 2 n=1 Tax=Stylonychia lemnae TaxID=5949 RepID=A0A078AL00_STYLE|nr:origin recognition complex subunit 2 [Stylonychia lemnae]|eukprot:CDW82556.1 origin recognition complex subunit 2 [Stylonychia lemnae]